MALPTPPLAGEPPIAPVNVLRDAPATDAAARALAMADAIQSVEDARALLAWSCRRLRQLLDQAGP